MSNIKFQRRKTYKSYSILLSIIIILALIIFIPQMLINRTRTIINHKLEMTSQDTSYVKLILAAESYLETADAFVIFRSKDEILRDELTKKAVERYIKSCSQADSANISEFCKTWAKVLSKEQLKKCEKCESSQ